MQLQGQITQDQPKQHNQGWIWVELTQATIQAILVSNSQESVCDSDSKNDHLNIDLLLTAQGDNE